MVLVSVAVVAVLYALNMRAYTAAADIAEFSFAASRGAACEERLAYAEDSVATFPGLANYPRRHIIRDSFNRLPSLSEDEFWGAVELMENTGNDALEVEPDNWRIMAMMVHLYQMAAERDSEYLAKAGESLDKMAVIAPNLPDTRILGETQASLTAAGDTP